MSIELLRMLQKAEGKIARLEEQSGETNSITALTTFPSNPYPNQVVIRTDLTPPDGGQMFRYDALSDTWLSLV